MPTKCYPFITVLFFFCYFSRFITNRKMVMSWAKCERNGPIFSSCKMPAFLEKSPLSCAKKYPNFQVTSCLHFVTTNVDFAYIESE